MKMVPNDYMSKTDKVISKLSWKIKLGPLTWMQKCRLFLNEKADRAIFWMYLKMHKLGDWALRHNEPKRR